MKNDGTSLFFLAKFGKLALLFINERKIFFQFSIHQNLHLNKYITQFHYWVEHVAKNVKES
jgi:hypothetical protein